MRLVYKAIILIIASFSCYLLQAKWHLNSVLSAAIVGTCGTFITPPKRYPKILFESLILSGAFIAMGTFFITHSILFLFFASITSATLFILLESYFHGLGGRLGFIAFISSLLSLLMSFILMQLGIS